jgi:chromate transporter
MQDSESSNLSELSPKIELVSETRSVSFWEAFRFWVKLGLISFGGPTGQIAIMHTELVEKKRWISESRFLHALNYCMMLPGPEAQQLAIYVGWLMHRTIGGIVAGAFFVLPSIFVLWSLSYVYVTYGKLLWISSMFYGLKGAVIAIVAAAVLRIGQKALRNRVMWIIAAVAFIAIFFLNVPFPLIVLGAGLIGLTGGKIFPSKFVLGGGHATSNSAVQILIDDDSVSPEHARPSSIRAAKVTAICLFLWWVPVLLIGISAGWDHTLFKEALFFSFAALITFGGAYAVLPYVAQQAVERFGWLSTSQMMDGLGLAETTPGPLIMVVQFVGFLGAWNHPGNLTPLFSATIGALITTWVTFLPCFLWIFLGAPHVEQLRGNVHLTSSLSAITAAVVGVVLNLAVWFAIYALFPKDRGIDWFLLGLSIAVFILMTRWKWDVIRIVLFSAVAGVLFKLVIA